MSNINDQIKANRKTSSKDDKTYNDISDLVKTDILGVAVTNVSAKYTLEYILRKITQTSEKFYLVTPNPEILVKAQKDPVFKNILNQARISLCDGVGMQWASRLLGNPRQQRITGVDMMERLCAGIVEKPITVGFLGGRPGVADEVSKRLQEKYPGLKVGFAGEEWPEAGDGRSEIGDRSKGKNEKHFHNLSAIPHKQVDLLFVAFGFPKQEIWMAEHIDKLDVRVMMGVGGAFDYISGRVPRAPKSIRSIGLEWLYRLIREPWRWRRQLALIEFVRLVLKQKLFLLSLRGVRNE